APFRGLSRYEGAPLERIRQAGRIAFERLVRACLEHQVDFLLLAGDLFDGSGKDFNTVLYMASHMRRLMEAKIEVFAVLGNHDAEHDLLKTNPFTSNVHLFAAEYAQTIHRQHLGVAVHGQSHASRSEKRNLAAGYPPAVPEAFNIGLLHTSLTGRDGHEPYAPCNEDDLVAHGYDYWALGHVHQREWVRRQDPMIHYPGTLQGRHIHESGEKGATLIEMDASGKLHEHPLAFNPVRWQILEIKLDEIESFNDFLDRTVEQMGRLVNPKVLTVVRLLLTGPCQWHGLLIAKGMDLEQELRIQTLKAGGDALWLERVENKSHPKHADQPKPTAGNLDPLTLIEQLAQELRSSENGLQSLA
ncbi:MAG TPA: DNA repair exonuclease, partial [Magnetococcales bacterium]|nr:DNA repair exonuclease [Magnetococcales bacterium]